MSSLILSNDLHLMMLEIAVENLFVPWTSEFDKVIIKKTTVMFRMLDEEWTPLSPNRYDCRSYRGSNNENEKFYGGGSVVFCVSEGFFEKEASDVNIQFHVQKEVCKYFEMNSRQDVGFVSVPVDDLLNSIFTQIRERNELVKYLSDFYKRQIISRSTTGTYTLRSEDLQDTAATISLYIRISSLGRSLVTEIASFEEARGLFRVRGESDEEDDYLARKLTARDLREGNCWDDLPALPRGRLVCRCEELTAEETTGLSDDRSGHIKKAGIINGPSISASRKSPKTAAAAIDGTTIGNTRNATVRMTAVKTNAVKGDLAIIPNIAAAAVGYDVTADAAADVDADIAIDNVTIPATKTAADIAMSRKEKAGEYNTLGNWTIENELAVNKEMKQPVFAPTNKRIIKNTRNNTHPKDPNKPVIRNKHNLKNNV